MSGRLCSPSSSVSTREQEARALQSAAGTWRDARAAPSASLDQPHPAPSGCQLAVTMKLMQQRSGALAAPHRPMSRCSSRNTAVLARPGHLAGGAAPRSNPQKARQGWAARQTPSRCVQDSGGWRQQRRQGPGSSPLAAVPLPAVGSPAAPYSPVRSHDMSSTKCRYLRGSSGPLGRPWVAIAACRRGDTLVVSATLVSPAAQPAITPLYFYRMNANIDAYRKDSQLCT
jgi:hypothetical protein